MHSWRWMGVALSLLVSTGHSVAMGSGPHPNLLYGVLPHPTATVESYPWGVYGFGISCGLLFVVLLAGAVRAFREK